MVDLPPLREVIERHGLWAKKSLGQNFLFDANLLTKIVRCAGDISNQTVYEVGPGPGGLTRAILAAGVQQVIAVERDGRAVAALAELAEVYPGKLHLHNIDALSVDESALIGGAAHIIANLPYNIGTPLLVHWLTCSPWLPWWQSLTLMFQKEVAQRIIAAPDTSAYGRLSVLAQWRSTPRLAMTVPREAFTPPPKITSAVVHIVPTAPQLDIPVSALEAVTAAAFGQRRKMLRSSLKSLTKDVPALLESACIDGDRRAETLGVLEFCQLAKAYTHLTGWVAQAAPNGK
jgi:16S rRNA (adenine1518-N6/adenine1519-N6)-dimethyltransferase